MLAQLQALRLVVRAGDDFYVADSDAIMKFSYHPGDTIAIGIPSGKPRDVLTGFLSADGEA
jgi:hypothetical protein